ncbi:MAG: Holliday junction resolvase RuvX [Clostridium sp.]
MRILGLDVGSKTIGVAISDPLGFTAQGITTIRRVKKEVDIEEVKKLCKEYCVESIVIGLPKNMNGSVGESGERMLEFCEVIREATGLKVETWDERLTTVAAHKSMIEGDLSRGKRKKIVDKIAATLILQGYLDKLAIAKRRESN